MPMDTDTIAAIATPNGVGGIGIIKISGPQSLPIIRRLFRRSGARTAPVSVGDVSAAPDFESHRAYYGHVLDPVGGHIIDEALVTVMKAPHSYTREDVAEISAHGGRSVLEAILGLALANGARPAEPGEFTLRAFLNGRIDLTQAEAVIDLINARSRSARQIAANQVSGQLRTAIESIRCALIDAMTTVEAGIDFPEEFEAEDQNRSALAKILSASVILPLKKLVDNFESARPMRDGVTALIIGRPNVGKSSLLNCLVQRERAIVTDIPGTTRDFIEENVQFKRTAVTIVDTAGLQATDDPIEIRGIEKTRELIGQADVVLFVLDASAPVDSCERDIFRQLADRRIILVQNKIDLEKDGAKPLRLPDEWQETDRVRICAKTGVGIEDLKEAVERCCMPAMEGGFQDKIVPNLRQGRLFRKALQHAEQGADILDKGLAAELLAIDLKIALRALDESIGVDVAEDVLEQIFSRFCIGK